MTAQRQVILLRHGETEWSGTRRHSGRPTRVVERWNDDSHLRPDG